MSKFQDLLSQIESFIKKYYKNEMVKGVFLFFIIFLLSFLIITMLEYFGRFSPTVRTFLFWSFIISNGFILVKYIFIPLLKLGKIGQRLSVNDASTMIGNLFPDVSDKLQNTLQLSAQMNHNNANIDLLQASIQQKASKLSAVPFTTGIEIGQNKKYLKYLVPILLIITAVLLLQPNIFSDGSNRIMNYSEEFVEEAPFEFLVVSSDTLMQGKPYELNIKLAGSEIPSEVKIFSSNGTYNLRKDNTINFSHSFANLNEDLEFYCEANGYRSKSFKVVVLQKPVLSNVTIKLNYPRHMKMASEVITDLSELSVPEGTSIDWIILSENTSDVTARFEDTTLFEQPNANKEFSISRKVKQSQKYSLILSTSQIKGADTIYSSISVRPDAYPEIAVVEKLDSLRPFSRFLTGTIKDDFGFSGLSLLSKVTRKDTIEVQRSNVKIRAAQANQAFAYELDMKDFSLKPGDVVEYYFLVTDNDAPNGFKSTTSSKMSFDVPDLTELDNDLSQKSENLKKDMDDALKDANEMKKEIAKIKNQLINKSTPDWKDKQNINSMLNQQESLQMKLENLKQQFEENATEENEFLENSEELLEKQELLEKLMEELMDDEMKELLEELQKMMDEMDRDEILENMENMEQKSKDLEKELDRTLELFKHLELDKKMEGIEEQLRELAEEQNALQEKTENKNVSPEELEKEQEELNDKFEEIQKDIEEAKKMNEELEKPKDMNFDKEKEDEIDQEMSEAKEKLGEKKEKKASESQKKAADMMEKMADDVKAMMEGASSKQNSEDMEKLRFLLENIVNLSHQQENLMKEYGSVDRNNPKVVNLNRDQLKINEATVIVKDSLMALAKRQAQLSNTILEELSDLEYNQEKAKHWGQERNLSKVKQHQQYAVTTYNDLALLLSQVLEQMQDAMKAMKPGSGSCDKPGGTGSGAPKPGQMSMQQMKDQLKKQMQQMKDGSQPGGKKGQKPGEGKGEGQQGLGSGSIPGLGAKEIAKMAMEQAQMRKALQGLRQELNKDGSGSGNGLNKVIDEMEKLENDLLNNGFTPDLFKRQQDIMTRLLENEKAIMERGYSEEREAKEGKNNMDGNQIELLEYNQKKEGEIELLRSVPLGLKIYYKNMVNSYFNTVNN
ncbi:MAG: hypothetical protein AB8B72_07450 [Crocinitomicaceae bacterium]